MPGLLKDKSTLFSTELILWLHFKKYQDRLTMHIPQKNVLFESTPVIYFMGQSTLFCQNQPGTLHAINIILEKM